MEPAMTVAEIALKILAEEAYKAIKEALEPSTDPVKRCAEFLNAASIAVWGLETDYDDILDQSEVCMLSARDDVVALQKHVLRHLNQDRFLNILKDANRGLMSCRTILQTQTDKIFFRLQKKEERQNAMAALIHTIESLDMYMKKLHEDTQYRSARTGVGLKWLMGIESRLNSALAAHRAPQPDLDELRKIQDDFVGYIQQARDDRTKDALRNSTVSIRRTIEELLGAFG